MQLAVRRPLPTGMIASAGAASAVGLGYIDPGNWATDFDAARYGTLLLWSIVASGIGAVLLQILAVRLAETTGLDLARAIALRWPVAGRLLWPVFFAAILATEIAEFTGLTVGVHLLFGAPYGVAIATAAGASCALLLGRGATITRFEGLAIATMLLVASAYLVELLVVHPNMASLAHDAFVPSLPAGGALLAVIGIVGATIMPHNLFLHGGLFLARCEANSPERRPAVLRGAVRSTIAALALCVVINGAILVVGAAMHAHSIESAFATLAPLAGGGAAACFGAVLCVVSLAATASGVYAGDYVCGSAAPVRISAGTRRLLAIAPASALIVFGFAANALIVISQVVLGLVLPAVVIPLLALAWQSPLRSSGLSAALVTATSAVAFLALICDGALLYSLLPSV